MSFEKSDALGFLNGEGESETDSNADYNCHTNAHSLPDQVRLCHRQRTSSPTPPTRKGKTSTSGRCLIGADIIQTIRITTWRHAAP